MKRFAALVFVSLLVCMAVLAQSPNATITGTVADAQGGSVPGAEVVARNIGTNLVYRALTSGDGTYSIPNLPIGSYEVTVAAEGFKKHVRSNILLEVQQRLRLDFDLEIGAVSESVSVTAETPRVQTEQGVLGSVIERQRIDQLPLNGRHVFTLVNLVPGVQPRFRDQSGFAEVRNQSLTQIRFNGGPVYGNQFFIDGAANTVPSHYELSTVPAADTVEEFKVETNAIKAEYGQSNGGIVSVVTKSGTNQFHGSLYEFFRNDALDARNAFVTQPNSVTGRYKPVLRFNQFGGTVGGPVRIPGVYDGRNRTFFFAGYEEWRHRTSVLYRATVPTDLERVGNFSLTRDVRGNVLPIYDPATTRPNPNGSGFIRDVFPGNIIPSNRLDPVAVKIMEFMPRPNQIPINPFTNELNFLSMATTPVDQANVSARFDHRFSESDSVFFRYSTNRNTRIGRGYGLGPADPDWDARTDQRDNHNAVVTHTHVFSPSTINELRFAGVRQYLLWQHPSAGGNFPELLGFPSIIPRDYFPRIEIGGMIPLGGTFWNSGVRAQHVIQLSDSATLIRGRHTIRFGFDHRWIRLNWQNSGHASGQFTFNSGLTANPQSPAGTGFGLATFLTGEVTGGSIDYIPRFAYQAWSNGSFIQDDFKMTRRLTLNLGLRYDLASGPTDRFNQFSNFDPFMTNPQTGLPGTLRYAGQDIPRNFVRRNNKNFGPRLGFAYDLTGDGKTAIRGGYGIIYAMVEAGDISGDNSNSLGYSANTSFAPPIANFGAFRLSQGPSRILQPLGAAGGPSAFRGQTVQFQDYNAPTPYVQQWNLTLQRQLPGNWVLGGSYAGNRGVKLFGANYNLNQLDPAHWALGLALQDAVDNPFFGQITAGPLAAARVSRSQLLVPYPDYGAVWTLANHGASSSYHSFQFQAEKRYSNGLSAMVSYTNSKLINDSFSTSGNQGVGSSADFRFGRLNRRLERALDQDDVSQRLVTSAVYELPFGPGKRFGNNVRGVLGHLVGGWQVNGIWTMQTGTPLIVRGTNNFTNINYPDVIRNPTLPRGERTVNRWFDTDAFRNPPDFVVGNAPRTLPNTRGPGMMNLDMSMFKTFRIREGMRAEFRAEAFNALNHVNLNNPNTSFSPNRQGINQNASFGRITSAMPARNVQLGARITF